MDDHPNDRNQWPYTPPEAERPPHPEDCPGCSRCGVIPLAELYPVSGAEPHST